MKTIPAIIRVVALTLAAILAVAANQAQARVRISVDPVNPTQGRTAVVTITGLKKGEEVRGRCFKKPIVFNYAKGRAVGLIGIDVGQNPGAGQITVEISGPDGNKKELSRAIKVVKRNYGVRRLKMATGTKKMTLESEQRFKDERTAIKAALKTISPVRLWRGRFVRPAPGRIISGFGRKTYINGGKKARYHSGTDYRAAKGRKVVASARGRVILTGHHLFAGKSIYIDHGQGLISMYFHLSKIVVRQGQMVNKGQYIARAGATGRVTGPHLHYGLNLAGARIDPPAFHQLIRRARGI